VNILRSAPSELKQLCTLWPTATYEALALKCLECTTRRYTKSQLQCLSTEYDLQESGTVGASRVLSVVKTKGIKEKFLVRSKHTSGQLKLLTGAIVVKAYTKKYMSNNYEFDNKESMLNQRLKQVLDYSLHLVVTSFTFLTITK
jgi:hypothetical protein